MEFLKFKLISIENNKTIKVEGQYLDNEINKISFEFPLNFAFLKKNLNSLFIIKHLSKNLTVEENVLKIPDKSYELSLAEEKIIFAVKSWEKGLDKLKISCYPLGWNGEIFEKIQIIDLNPAQIDQFLAIINKDNLMLIDNIKNYFTHSLEGKISKQIILKKNQFNDFKQTISRRITLIITVKEEEEEEEYFLITPQESLVNLLGEGWEKYKKIRIKTLNKINAGDELELSTKNLEKLLEEVEKSEVLKVDDKCKINIFKKNFNSRENEKKETDNLINSKNNKLIKEHKINCKKKVDNLKNKISKKISFFEQVYDKLKDSQGQELKTKFFNLYSKLESIDNEEKKFTAQNDNDLEKEIKVDEENLNSLENEINHYQTEVDKYLKEKWNSFLEKDSRIKEMLNKYNFHLNFLEGFSLEIDYSWLDKENGHIDYSEFEKFLIEKKELSKNPDLLKYKISQITPGGKYEKWKLAGIPKNEAKLALRLNYNPEQWNNSEYQSYKEKDRIVSELIIKVLDEKIWKPVLSEEETTVIKSSNDLISLLENIFKIEKDKNFYLQIREYRKSIKTKLAENPPINEKEFFNKFVPFFEKEIVEKKRSLYKKIREIILICRAYKNKLSLKEIKENIKNEIKNLENSKNLLSEELELIDSQQDIEEVIKISTELVTLINEKQINLKIYNWFPELVSNQKKSIKNSRDIYSLKKITSEIRSEGVFFLLANGVDQYLTIYHDLQKTKKQNYNLQAQNLEKAKIILDKICKDYPLKEKAIKIHKNVCSLLEIINKLAEIKKKQKQFNYSSNLKILQEIEKLFSDLEKLKRLTFLEENCFKQILKNIKSEKETNLEKLSIVNEKQEKINLFNLKQEVKNKINHGKIEEDIYFRKQLLITSFFFSIVFLISWWMKRKKRLDPFE